ncbi:MAG TPA: hypothetical protein DC005_07925, partial [Proteobacteria bacterium]|nr:hypothetical protein [Pseudomonadota bacterium]
EAGSSPDTLWEITMREEHKQDTIGYQGSKVPWWLVLYYAAFMVAAFNYMGTFFARDLFDWNADAKRMQHDLWQGRNVDDQQWQSRDADGEYADQKGGWFYWISK